MARVLKGVVAAEQPRLFNLRRGTIDDDFTQTGQMLATAVR